MRPGNSVVFYLIVLLALCAEGCAGPRDTGLSTSRKSVGDIKECPFALACSMFSEKGRSGLKIEVRNVSDDLQVVEMLSFPRHFVVSVFKDRHPVFTTPIDKDLERSDRPALWAGSSVPGRMKPLEFVDVYFGSKYLHLDDAPGSYVVLVRLLYPPYDKTMSAGGIVSFTIGSAVAERPQSTAGSTD